MERIEALGKFLGIELEDGESWEDHLEEESYTENEFRYGNSSYLVLTDSEADTATQDYVKDSLWAFNAEFLAEQTELPEEVFQALSERCEDANEPLTRIVDKCVDGGIEAFTQAAVSADGRGHYLNRYDGHENEYEGYFIYRTN